MPNTTIYPATWRNDLLEMKRDWSRWFKKDPAKWQSWEKGAAWEEQLYTAGEELYTLGQDMKTHRKVYHDLIKLHWPPNEPVLATALDSVQRSQQKLAAQAGGLNFLADIAQSAKHDTPISHK